MINIKKVENELNNKCSGCRIKYMTLAKVSIANTVSYRKFNLCNDCLFLLISKIKEYLND